MKNKWKILMTLGLLTTSLQAQIGVGTTNPNKSAQLEVKSENSGILIPRIKLISTADNKTIKNGNVESLLVYNTANGTDVRPGYYYWNGFRWFRIATGNASVNNGNGAPGAGNPPAPIKGDIYVDNSTGDLYTYNGDTWNIRTGISIDPENQLTKGSDGLPFYNGVLRGEGNPNKYDNPNKPKKPKKGDIYMDMSAGDMYMFDGETWKVMTGISADAENALKEGSDGLPYYKESSFSGTGNPNDPDNPDAPTDPQIGDIYYDGDTNNLYVYDGHTWNLFTGVSADADNVLVEGSDGLPYYRGTSSSGTGNPNDPNNPNAPTDPQVGDIYVDRSTGDMYYYDGDSWNLLTGVSADAENALKEGSDGLPYYKERSFSGTGNPNDPDNPDAPTDPQVGDIYYDGDTNHLYAFDGDTWNVLTGVSVDADNVLVEGSDGLPYYRGTSSSGTGNPTDPNNPDAPTDPQVGDIYVDRSTGDMYYYDGDSWNLLTGVSADADNALKEGSDGLPYYKERSFTGTGNPNDPDNPDAPTDPQVGDIYYDGDTNHLYAFDGDTWNVLTGVSVDADNVLVEGSDGLPYYRGTSSSGTGNPTDPNNPDAPTDPQVGDIYVDRSTGDMYYYDGDSWNLLTGVSADADNALKEGSDGLPYYKERSFTGTGNPNDPDNPDTPTDPQIGDIYYDGDTNHLYAFDGDTWNVLTGVSVDVDNVLVEGSDGLPYYRGTSSSGTGNPTDPNNPDAPTDPHVGDIYVDRSTGDMYYYDGDSWNLLTGVSADAGNVLIEGTDGLPYFDIDVLNSAQTITTLTDNGDGTYTYTSEDGTITTVDVPADIHNEFIDETSQVFNDIKNIVESEETVTTLTANGDGTYTYTSEDGTITTVDVPADIHNEFIDETSQVFNDIKNIVESEETVTTLTDNEDGTYTYTSEDGTITTVDVPADIHNEFIDETSQVFNDIKNIVESEETVTTLTANGDGTYTYTSEDGTVTVIDNARSGTGNPNTGGVSGNPGDIYIDRSTGDVYTFNGTTWNVRTGVSADAGNVLTEGTDGLPYFDTGVLNAAQTITTLTANGDGTYTYTSEDGTITTIDVPADIHNEFIDETSQVFNDIKNIIESEETVTTLTANGDGTYTYTSEDGTITTVDVPADIHNEFIDETSQVFNDIKNIVESEETVTTLTANGDGTYTYTSEDGTVTVIDNARSGTGNPNTGGVSGNPGDIYIDRSTGDVYTFNGTTWNVRTGVSADAGNVLTEGTDGLPYFDIDVLNSAQTITTLTDNGDGTYTYTSEDGTITTIDVPADIHNEFIDETSQVFNDIKNIIESEETVTTLTANGDGTYTYTSEDGTITTVDVPADIHNEFIDETSQVFNDIKNIVESEETVTTLTDNEDGTYTYTSEDGTITTVDVPADIHNEFIDQTSEVFNDIKNIVESEETVTTLTANGDGTYTYTSEDGTVTVIDNARSGTGNPNTGGVSGNPGDIYIDRSTGDVYTFNGTTWNVRTGVSADAGNVLTEGTDGLPYFNTAVLNAAQTITTLTQNDTTGDATYTNEVGTVTTIDVVSTDAGNVLSVGTDGGAMLSATTVKNTETTTTLTQNDTTGDATYTNEDGTVTTVDVVSSDANNAIKVGADGGAYLNSASVRGGPDKLTTLTQNDTTGDATYTNEEGTKTTIDVVSTDTGNVLSVGTDGGAMLSATTVKNTETTTTLTQNDTTGDATYTNEDGTVTTVDVVSTDAGNLITVGADGGAKLTQTAVAEPWNVAGTTNPATANTQNIYQTGNVGVGISNPGAKLHVDSGVANNSGVRLEKLTSASPKGTSEATLAVDANGNVVRSKSPIFKSTDGGTAYPGDVVTSLSIASKGAAVLFSGRLACGAHDFSMLFHVDRDNNVSIMANGNCTAVSSRNVITISADGCYDRGIITITRSGTDLILTNSSKDGEWMQGNAIIVANLQ